MRFRSKWNALVRRRANGHAARAIASASSGRPVARDLMMVSGLSADRVARIRQRVRDGFYASPNVMHQLAARLLDSGEL
jgi:hypothetical protein